MKKNFFRSIAVAALMWVGVGNMSAQTAYEVPPIDEELKAMAQEVVDLQLTDPEGANKTFMKLYRKVRKDQDALLGIGHFFLEKDNFAGAMQFSKYLYDLAPTHVPGLLFGAEVYMKAQNWGAAGQRYDEVLAQDSTNLYALKRNAFVYKNINPYVAKEMLERIKRLDPSDYEVNKELGDIEFNASAYPKAVEHYDAYYQAVPKELDKISIRSCENYLMALFSVGKFEQITTVVAELEPLAPNDMMVKRMKFFSSVENLGATLDYDGAIKKATDNMGYIVNKEFNDSLYLYLDYVYAANLEKEKGNTADAVTYYETALKTDSTKLNGYIELSKLYARNKQFDESIASYKKFIDKTGLDNVKISDLLGYGRTYVTACANQDSLSLEKRQEYIAAGDPIFELVLQRDPEAYQAMIFRARLNIINGNEPEDRPTELYTQALQMMEGREKVDASRFEACRYLAFRGIKLDLLDDARKYVDIMLSIRPNDRAANQFNEYLKSQNK